MKQTAVEFLVEQLKYTQKEAYNDLYEVIEQAKQMFKDQVTDAYWDGGQDVPSHVSACENYYNETFKQSC